MAITPQTDVYLIKSPLEEDNQNQLTFSSKTAQANYFSNLPHILLQGFTYQRKDNIIRVPRHIDDIRTYNYVMYKNNAYDNKFFYAFVTKMEYINDNMTAVTIKTDVMQTWLFDIDFKRSFVEREHVNNDTIGLHTIDEPVGTGEYISNNFGIINTMGNSQNIVIGVSKLLTGMKYWPTRQYTGVYSGLYLYTFHNDGTYSAQQNVSHFIRAYDLAGYGADIVEMYLVPSEFILNDVDWQTINYTDGNDTVTVTYGLIKGTLSSSFDNVTIPINTTLDGYTPKNKKMFVAPFNYLYLSNNVGSDVVYHYEDFENNTPHFLSEGVISIGCSTKVYPINYKRQTDDTTVTVARKSFNYGITAGKLPTCSWLNDSYTNWITQNGINVAIQDVTGAITGTASAFTGNLYGAVGGYGEMAQAISSVHSASMIPNSVGGNVNSGDIAFSTRNLNVIYHQMSVRREIAESIDNFFSMYGYQVNSLKVPNRTGRRNWNYVKTINSNIEGDIPQDDLNEIKTIFDNGVTLWHNTATFLDYSQNNDII